MTTKTNSNAGEDSPAPSGWAVRKLTLSKIACDFNLGNDSELEDIPLGRCKMAGYDEGDIALVIFAMSMTKKEAAILAKKWNESFDEQGCAGIYFQPNAKGDS